MKSQSGFTLVEVMVTSVLSAVLAGAILSCLYMTNTQVIEGTVSQHLTASQLVVSEQIRVKARTAYLVKRSSDAITTLPAASLNDGVITGLKQVVFCGTANDTLAGYRLSNTGVMKEWKNHAFTNFMIGTDSVTIDYANSEFVILPRRRGVQFRILYTRTESGLTYTFPPIRETVICRNMFR